MVLASVSALAAAPDAQPLVVTDSLTVTQTVAPDKMISSVTVNYKGASNKAVTAAMEKAVAKLTPYKDISVFYGYNVEPVYRYVDSRQTLDGYRGSMTVSCNFIDIQRYSGMVNAFFDLASTDKAYEVGMSSVNREVSDKLTASMQDKLRTQAVAAVLSSASLYSGSLKMSCTVRDIAVDQPTAYPVYRNTMMMAKSAVSITPPDNQPAPLSLTVRYSLTCK